VRSWGPVRQPADRYSIRPCGPGTNQGFAAPRSRRAPRVAADGSAGNGHFDQRGNDGADVPSTERRRAAAVGVDDCCGTSWARSAITVVSPRQVERRGVMYPFRSFVASRADYVRSVLTAGSTCPPGGGGSSANRFLPESSLRKSSAVTATGSQASSAARRFRCTAGRAADGVRARRS